jgi:hypothetical protein
MTVAWSLSVATSKPRLSIAAVIRPTLATSSAL